MSTPDATDLRIAALSDRKHAAAPEGGLLNMLLPDVPGAPYGGTTTPEQRAATVAVTRLPLPASARPADLRAALRAWAASQTQPRWEIRPYNTPNEHVWVILRDSKAVAEVYDRRDAEFVLAALRARPDTQPVRPGTDNATGLRTTIQTLQGLTEDGQPDLLARLQASLTRAKEPPC